MQIKFTAQTAMLDELLENFELSKRGILDAISVNDETALRKHDRHLQRIWYSILEYEPENKSEIKKLVEFFFEQLELDHLGNENTERIKLKLLDLL